MTWGLIHQVRERARDAASPRVTSAGNRNERKRSGTSVSGREELRLIINADLTDGGNPLGKKTTKRNTLASEVYSGKQEIQREPYLLANKPPLIGWVQKAVGSKPWL